MQARKLKLHSCTHHTPIQLWSVWQSVEKSSQFDRFFFCFCCLSDFATTSFWQNDARQVNHQSTLSTDNSIKANCINHGAPRRLRLDVIVLGCTRSKQSDGWTTETEPAAEGIPWFFLRKVVRVCLWYRRSWHGHMWTHHPTSVQYGCLCTDVPIACSLCKSLLRDPRCSKCLYCETCE
jgi:hypothetical protein